MFKLEWHRNGGVVKAFRWASQSNESTDLTYESIDKMQLALAEGIFAYAKDRKKTSGRALGTFVEILTFYLVKAWGLASHTAIERRLPEYANPEITHKVELSLHPKLTTDSLQPSTSSVPLTVTKINKDLP